MAVSPKVSMRKLGKTIASLRRGRKVKVEGKGNGSDDQDYHGRDGVSECSETLASSIIMEEPCSFRVDDGPNQSMIPSRHDGVRPLEDPASSCVNCEAFLSPRMSTRKVLSPADEAKFSPWSSPILRRTALAKLDSWLFLSSARGFAGGPVDDHENDNDSDSEEMTSEHGEDDVVPPLMPVKRAVPKSGFLIDRRGAMQREDSWLTMMVDEDSEST